jgi:chaperonin GroES
MKLRPLGDRVVVKPLARDEVTKSGIILPETVGKERPEKGEVIAIGPGKTQDDGKIAPMHVKVGDKIVFKSYASDEIKIDGQEYLLVSEADITGVIEG